MTDNLAAQAEAAARERRAALVGSPWERQKFPMSDAKLESETVFLESLAAELRSQQQVIEAQAEGLRINDETVSKLGAELRKKDAENAKMREALKQYELDPCNCEPDSGKPSCPACYTRAALASNAGADFLAELETLRAEREDHGPNGRNVTNVQWVALLAEREELLKENEALRAIFGPRSIGAEPFWLQKVVLTQSDRELLGRALKDAEKRS